MSIIGATKTKLRWSIDMETKYLDFFESEMEMTLDTSIMKLMDSDIGKCYRAYSRHD